MKENIIPEKGIEIKGYNIISSDIIKSIYFSIEELGSYDNIKTKLNRTSLILSKYIEDNYDLIMSEIKKQYKKNIATTSKELNKNELEKISFIEKELKNGYKKYIKKYFSSLIPNILNVYIAFLNNIKKYINIDLCNNMKEKIKMHNS